MIKQKLSYGVSLDLTKTRFDVLKEARVCVADIDNVKFVYSDINCYLRAFLSDAKHLSFSSVSDLEYKLSSF